MPIYGKNETLHHSSTNTLFIYQAKKFGSETLFEGYIISFITQKFTILNFYCLSFVAIVLLFVICPNMVKDKVWCRGRKLTELIGLQKYNSKIRNVYVWTRPNFYGGMPSYKGLDQSGWFFCL